MNLISILTASSQASSASSGSGSGTGSMESLKKIFQSPVLYIVLGVIVLLIIAFYLYRRFVKAAPNATTIIVRKGKIHKVLNKDNPKCFMTPFMDSVGAVITEGVKELSSDKLFINNGPDALYKVNYTLRYTIKDPVVFYPYAAKLNEALPAKLNDELRLYADNGNALTIVKDYRTKSAEILEVINKAIAEYQIEAVEFKINLIQPM